MSSSPPSSVGKSPFQEFRRPMLDRPPGVRYALGGMIGKYVDALTQNWLLKVPDTNPAILDMFRTRDEKPYRSLLPWSGEFAGKYLTGAVQVYRLTGDSKLKDYLGSFVAKLVSLQDAEGYMGPFPPENRLSEELPPAETRTFNGVDWANWQAHPWDVWGHYHAMLGLLLWHQESNDPAALECAIRMADFLCGKFLHTGKRIVDLGDAETNLAIIHSLCLLYRVTRTNAYLQLAQQIAEREFPDNNAGDYLRTALAGKEFYEGPKPRWESLHPIQGLAELYWLTDEERYREAYEQIWWSIVKLDRHNNGGFSSGEKAQGNPYHQGAIETCCTVAWVALTVDMLRLTGNSIVADELELSTLNQILGYEDHAGKGCTYDTPMDGIRIDSTKQVSFQIRPGSEELNCCSANAPRGFGMISDWALMADESGLALNWYGPSILTAQVKGIAVTLKQETDYPRQGRINLEISPEKQVSFPLKLRIPHWSAHTSVQVNGEPVASVPAGKYLVLDRTWAAGDKVQIDLDMSLHFWIGERELEGRASIYRGPVLLVREIPSLAIRPSPHWSYLQEWCANKPGAILEFDFEGARVIWEGHFGDDGGQASVLIDGHVVGTIDQYGPDRSVPFFWEYGNLAPGKHTIRITILEQRHPASKGHWINAKSVGSPRIAEPIFDASHLEETSVSAKAENFSQAQLEVTAIDQRKILLRDYGTAGRNCMPYQSWHFVENILPAPFSITNPSRSSRQRVPSKI